LLCKRGIWLRLLVCL
nr:immunoglobulin heavy chain junction region [Mus musculus]